MKALLMLAAALLLSACAPKHPIVGNQPCSVWTETRESVEGRALSAEYAAGFFDAYPIYTETKVKYGWVIDVISEECTHDPSQSIGEASKKAALSFAK